MRFRSGVLCKNVNNENDGFANSLVNGFSDLSVEKNNRIADAVTYSISAVEKTSLSLTLRK